MQKAGEIRALFAPGAEDGRSIAIPDRCYEFFVKNDETFEQPKALAKVLFY